MEESISFTKSIREGLGLDTISPRQLSPLVLAYIGDCAYDLIIKTMIVSNGNTQVNKMNKMTSSLVKAQTQSVMIGIIEPLLNKDEEAVYKRGRNAKSYTSAKNASITDYRRATGFEALVGYLYLTEQFDRLIELVKIGLKSDEVKKAKPTNKKA